MHHKLQSRISDVKCCVNGELSHGRKAVACGQVIRIPLPIRGFLNTSGLRIILLEVFFMFKNLSESAKNIKNLRVLCATALLSALYVALYSVKIPLGEQLRITFTFVPVALAGWLFGIVPAVIVGALGDLLGCWLFPQGAYFFGYTLTSMLTGLIFGLLLYKRDSKGIIWYVILSKLLVSIILNTGLNSYWATFFVSKSVFVIMWGKLVKNIIMLPVEVLVLFAVIGGLNRAGVQKMYK